ncbi:MAG TPA: diphthamide biosynthesis enzyme Dph2 [Nitrososphaerales archaeon]|nr:diphthamide biosynthesis enzyme Dph2 [Nitrososphaerales archaeon]
MTIRIDRPAIEELVQQNRPKRVVFNAPDGLLRETRSVAQDLENRYGLQAIVIADPTYGSCDTVDLDAQRLGADLAFHIGHNVTIKKFGKITYSIDATDDVSFATVAKKAVELLKEKGARRAGLATFAQHTAELSKVAQMMEENGITALVGKGGGQLHDGQIFGCEFYPAFNIREKVDVMLLLGPSMFHALGLCLSTGKPTYMLDPYQDEVIDVNEVAEERLKKAILSVYKARDASKFGVIIGLKEGQIMTDQSLRLKKELESRGKSVQLIALREITTDRINAMTDIEAFVQTGCPRISVDGYNFGKPVLSVPQTDALLKLLSGKEVSMEMFQTKHWL